MGDKEPTRHDLSAVERVCCLVIGLPLFFGTIIGWYAFEYERERLNHVYGFAWFIGLLLIVFGMSGYLESSAD
jgi:hypothetical protein